MYARVRKALPELYAFTACMWLRSRSGGTGQGTPFSYSVPGQANEIVLLEAGHEPMELLINDKVGGAGGWGWGGTFCTARVPTWPGAFVLPLGNMKCLLCVRHTGVWGCRDKPDSGQTEEGLVLGRGRQCCHHCTAVVSEMPQGLPDGLPKGPASGAGLRMHEPVPCSFSWTETRKEGKGEGSWGGGGNAGACLTPAPQNQPPYPSHLWRE